MRVIGGRFKGQQLVSFKASHIRPTTDRVKESLFNILGDLSDCRVLDAYAGTGSLGIEALSRGADNVCFVENHRKSIHILRQNIEKIGIATGEYRVISKDTVKFLQEYRGSAFDVILFDPPFTKKLADTTMRAVAQSAAADATTRVFIEASTHETLNNKYLHWTLVKQRDYGDKVLAEFTCEE